MSPPVVGVHGIGNLQVRATPEAAADVLSARWTAGLRRGLGADAATQVQVSYYAHRLASQNSQAGVELESLDDVAYRLLLAWAGELGAPDEVAQGRLTAPARAAADWIAHRFGAERTLVRRFVARFCPEVATYLDDPGRRGAARDDVADTVAAHRPRVVIAHSLGSVVAYEALWAHPSPTVELLVTVGSPLGLPGAIFDRLQPAPTARRGQRPPGVQRWVNIADPGDLVAIPRAGLAGLFEGIDADLTTPIGIFDFHKVLNYLSCPTTAGAVAAAL
jgi:hypothetical protein